uniref:TPX2 C-terminal domain-containing protein n=1 Tax=Setaria viridis TaxID=4556 RepID=A0A4V6D4W4_SETVI|nr:hypothetical protein SEVIR_7G328333v2 [Setaria viridis]
MRVTWSSHRYQYSCHLISWPNRLCSSLDGKADRFSWDSKTSAGGRRSRRTSSESLRSSWNRKLKVTSQHPFKLRTEQRGRFKEQQLAQTVKEMLLEEEKKCFYYR